MTKSNVQPIGMPTQFKFYFIILSLFSSTWLISNITAVKLINVFGITLTGGFIVFPLTMMLGTVIVEVYGYKNSRQAIWAGFILNSLFVFFTNLVGIIPPSPHWSLQNEYSHILIPDSRIIIASLISFMLSDFSNSYLMAKMKIKSKGKSLLKRILTSYSLSISIDILCFMILAFAGAIPTFLLIKLISAAFIKKILFQIALLPFTCFLIDWLKRKEEYEIYDYDTKFNPFSIDNIYQIGAFKNIESTNSNATSNGTIIVSFSENK